MKINQLANSISKYDAVSNQIIAIKNVLQELGHESKIYVKYKDNSIQDNAITILHEKNDNNSKITPVESSLTHSDIVIFHHFNKSLLLDTLKNLNCKKILYYHNITPPSFFIKSDKDLAQKQEIGIHQLSNLKTICKIGIGSKYNQIQLENMGFKKTYEISYYIDGKHYCDKNNRLISKDKIYDNLIFIGRIAPNKKHEDIIKIFYYYSNFINPNSRLFFTGKIDDQNLDPYQTKLKLLIKKLGLEHKVIFLGRINFQELLSLYRLADIFICMSEHEGFCVPIIESMLMKVPVLAFKSTAIPYTMNNRGILVDEKNHNKISQIIGKILNDNDLKKKIIEDQFEYVSKVYNYKEFKKSLESLIQEINKC